MVKQAYTPLQLAQRFIDQREIQNVMGKYAMMTMICKQTDITGKLWAQKADKPTLARNNGWYVGLEAIQGYYQAVADNLAAKARLLKTIFPAQLGGKSDQEAFGAGEHYPRPLTSPLVEVAADGQTAKGLWHCQGAYNDVETCGPVANWTWGYFAVDFIRTEDGWKLWHMSYTNDVDCICGQSWGKEKQPLPDLPEFAALADFHYPPYTVEKTLRELYTPARPHTDCPRIPEPYNTFAETFSYGI